MEKLKNFEHNMFGELSVYGTPEEPMFNAGEVALKLWSPKVTRGKEYPNIQKLNNCFVGVCTFTFTDFITESQLYMAIIKSNSKSAVEFQMWVVDVVLPTIRRTGGFVNEGASEQFINTYFPNMSETEKAFFAKSLEENRILQEKLTKSEAHVSDLVENFKPGTTLTQAILQLNGVKQKGLLAHLIAKKKIKIHSKDWVTSGEKLYLQTGYLPTGQTRSWFQVDYIETDGPVAKTRHGKWYYRRETILTLTETGMKALYSMYKSKKLPMLAEWDGKFYFTKPQ